MNGNFIKASEKYCTLQNYVAAPLLRKSFTISSSVISARIAVCGLGFYILTVNGKDVTKGHIAPYVSNPDDCCYYDEYDVTELIVTGENVIGIILGNGFINSIGGEVWDFDKASFRSSPKLDLHFEAITKDGTVAFCADDTFRTHPSPILMDDLRLGEIYDARAEIEGWNIRGFDDTEWERAIVTDAPKGEARLCEAEPIAVIREITPVSVTAQNNGYLYDFGINTAGVCRLNINAHRGQKITMWHGEVLRDGIFSNDGICFSTEKYPFYKEFNQTVRYIASGE